MKIIFFHLLNWLRLIRLGIISVVISLKSEFSLLIGISLVVKFNATSYKSGIFFCPTSDLNSVSQLKRELHAVNVNHIY